MVPQAKLVMMVIPANLEDLVREDPSAHRVPVVSPELLVSPDSKALEDTLVLMVRREFLVPPVQREKLVLMVKMVPQVKLVLAVSPVREDALDNLALLAPVEAMAVLAPSDLLAQSVQLVLLVSLVLLVPRVR